MRFRSVLGGPVSLLGTLGLFVSCSDIDTNRSIPPRGTIGEEVYGVFCDRIAAQSLREDLTGAASHAVCHKVNGAYSDKVDQTLLPPIGDNGVDSNGNPVSKDKQTKDRTTAVARVEAMAVHRANLIAALDAAIPDISVAIKDTTNQDAKKTCDGKGEAKLGHELAAMLGRFMDLYNDGTIPSSTRSFAHLTQAFQQSPEAQAALARLATRKGYRPTETALGAMRPALAYPKLRDMSNATLSLLSRDSDPYGDVLAGHLHTPTPGPGYPKLTQLVEASRIEMSNVVADPPVMPIIVTNDALTGRSIISRPRDDIEMLQLVLYAQDPAFGAGNPRYIVRRDSRGYADVALVNNMLPAPFVDKDKDGLADVDEFGQFVSSNGSPPPAPFPELNAPDTPTRDMFGRALSGGSPIYVTIDTSHTFAASMLQNMRPLVNPDMNANHESLMYALGGLYVIAGTRVPDSQRAYADGQSITYEAYDPTKSPLIDFVHAMGQLIGDPAVDDMLAYEKIMMTSHVGDIARLAGAGLAFKDVANKHPEASIPPKSVFWDEMLDVAVKIEKVPGLLEDVLRSMSDDNGVRQGQVLANYLAFDDHISYDRKNLNGPAWNFTTSTNDEMKTPVDRSKPDAGWNKSAFHRFLQIVHDGNNVTVCNKDSAVVHARGVPIIGSIDLPLTGTYKECEVMKIDNVTKFYIQSVVGKAKIYMRPSILRNGIVGIGAATVDTIQQSSGIDGFWDPASSKTLRPKPQYLNRQVFFDQAGDSPNQGDPNYITNRFLRDLMGPHVGSLVCPERVINDPDPTAADAAQDGLVHGLRSCQNGDWLDQRDSDALFVLENFGGYSAMAPMMTAFANRNQEDLFIEMLEVLYRHWPDDKSPDCNKSGDYKSNPRFCNQDGAVTYEPLMSEAFQGDLFAALNQHTKTAITQIMPSCTATNPGTKSCISTVTKDGITLTADAIRAAIDPDRAKANGVTSRTGAQLTTRNDGSTGGPMTPIYLLTNALNEVDAAFAAYAGLHPEDNKRQDKWRLARSQLVDQFLGVTGMGAQAQFTDPSLAKISPTIIDMLRAQLWVRCPDSFGTTTPKRCAWSRDDWANKLGDVVKGPLFSTSLDLTDTIRANDPARVELEALLQYLVDVASTNDAFAAMLASSIDIMQVLRDDTNIVPLFHVLAQAFATSKLDDKNVPSMIDAQSSMLARISGRAFDGDKVEICGIELDPNQILSRVLTNLVTPVTLKDKDGKDVLTTPAEVLMDVIADLNRVDPARSDRLDVADYGSVTGSVTDFLLNKEHGLEQFYEIIRQGTLKQ
jgi:hypothetical protein